MILLAFLSSNVIFTAHLRENHKSRRLVEIEVVPLEHVFQRLKTLIKLKRKAADYLRFSNVLERPTSKI